MADNNATIDFDPSLYVDELGYIIAKRSSGIQLVNEVDIEELYEMAKKNKGVLSDYLVQFSYSPDSVPTGGTKVYASTPLISDLQIYNTNMLMRTYNGNSKKAIELRDLHDKFPWMFSEDVNEEGADIIVMGNFRGKSLFTIFSNVGTRGDGGDINNNMAYRNYKTANVDKTSPIRIYKIIDKNKAYDVIKHAAIISNYVNISYTDTDGKRHAVDGIEDLISLYNSGKLSQVTFDEKENKYYIK